MHLYYDRQGKPMSREEFARRFDDMDYRSIGLDTVGPIQVSTVWLGIDHSFGRGRPLIFETMAFDEHGGEWLDLQERYATEAEARAGHATVLRAVQDAQRPPGGTREELITPSDSRPIAEPQPGSVDISGLDKAELLAALVNATKTSPFHGPPMTHEQAAALIQDRLGAGDGPPFDFDYVDGRPIKCDIGGQYISAFHVALYDRDAGEGTAAQVVGELRAAYERRQAERNARQ